MTCICNMRFYRAHLARFGDQSMCFAHMAHAHGVHISHTGCACIMCTWRTLAAHVYNVRIKCAHDMQIRKMGLLFIVAEIAKTFSTRKLQQPENFETCEHVPDVAVQTNFITIV